MFKTFNTHPYSFAANKFLMIMNHPIKGWAFIRLFMLLFLFVPSAYSQQSIQGNFTKDADQFIEQALKDLPTIPGVIMTVVKDGQSIYTKGFGYANRESKLPMQDETSFYIASCTKSFTALLASIYDQRGLIDLDAPLTKYFPNVDFKPELKAGQVKVRDLLTHTSGIENGGISFRVAYSGDHNHEKLMQLMNHCEPNKAGYGNFQYTNTGYNIYALILQEHLGKPWQQCLEEEIFKPLGMSHTTAYISRATTNDWPLARPYIGYSTDDIEAVYLLKKDNTMQSAGGLITTGKDIGKWLQVQLMEGRLNGQQVFPKKLIQQSQNLLATINEPRNDPFEDKGYGMGWMINEYNGEKVVAHFGGFPGYLTHISFMPEQNIGVAVMVNEGIMGYRLMHLLGTYTYDWWLDNDGQTNEKYQESLSEMAKYFENISSRIAQSRAKRAKREWDLKLPFEGYTGVYHNDIYGTVYIDVSKEALKIRMGNMHCTATPFKSPEAIRVEMVPGSGEVIEFLYEGDAVSGFNYDDSVFTKLK